MPRAFSTGFLEELESGLGRALEDGSTIAASLIDALAERVAETNQAGR